MKIRPLTRQQEKKLLVAILYNLDGQLPNGVTSRVKREIAGLVMGVLFAIMVLCTVIEPNIYKALLVGVTFATGLLAGVLAWRYTAAAQWPVVAKCIDRSQIESRLRELDA
jgi:hypothetical protein